MTALRVRWEEREADVGSAAELDALIAEVRATGQPMIISLETIDGRFLAFGVGADESVLIWLEPDGTSFHSLGPDRSRMGMLQFWSHGELTDFHAELAIPEDVAIRAAHHFVGTQERSPDIEWEAD